MDTGPSSPANSIEGNCNAQGTGNTVECNSVPDRIGEVTAVPRIGGFLFLGPPTALPTPPSFESQFNHCGEWHDWVASNPNMFSMTPGGYVQAIGDKLVDQVAIIDVKVTIFSRRSIDNPAITRVKCFWGGGENDTYTFRYDTLKGTTALERWSVDGLEETSPVPPASLQLDELEYIRATLAIHADRDYLYSGRVVVTAIINGETKTLGFGSKDQPYRWVGDPENPILGGPDYDWNSQTSQWAEGHQSGQ